MVGWWGIDFSTLPSSRRTFHGQILAPPTIRHGSKSELNFARVSSRFPSAGAHVRLTAHRAHPKRLTHSPVTKTVARATQSAVNRVKEARLPRPIRSASARAIGWQTDSRVVKM